MKVLRQIPHPSFQITLFAWNQKYILKYEQALLEQTYKVSELDVSGEDEVADFALQPDFLDKVARRFAEMQQDWQLIYGVY